MLFNPIEGNDFDRLAAAVRHAAAPTAELIQSVIASCTRLPNLGKKAAQRIARMVEAGAFTDAALAVIACELPQWQLRRLVCDDGEWLCALSRQPQMPEDLDDTADGRHAVAALAILDAFLEARNRTIAAREMQLPAVPTLRPASDHMLCCDNFS